MIHRTRRFLVHAAISIYVALVTTSCSCHCSSADDGWLLTGDFQWESSEPMITVRRDGNDPDVALKDPTIVFHDGFWHLFATHRVASGKVDMQYLKFRDWTEADQAKRHTLHFMDTYHCAPQVFFFAPHNRWYLIYQASMASLNTNGTLPEHFVLMPVFSTTETLDDPNSWTTPKPMIEIDLASEGRPKWIDFWVICDQQKAHLFYTSDDGHFWRRETKLSTFPLGWTKPKLELKDTKNALFEASHTYSIKGTSKYLTIIEAIGDGRRYYKAWLADHLEGPWQPLAATESKPLAAIETNVQFKGSAWTESVSHAEFLRSGVDQTLEIDPDDLKLVYQGADREGYRGNRYGQIPWKLAILRMVKNEPTQ